MLQNCMGLNTEEPDSCSEACITTSDYGNEEGNSQTEEENPEAVTFPPVKPEPEVSVWCMCIGQQRFMLAGIFTATKKINSENTLQLSFSTYISLRTVHYPDQTLHYIYHYNR